MGQEVLSTIQKRWVDCAASLSKNYDYQIAVCNLRIALALARIEKDEELKKNAKEEAEKSDALIENVLKQIELLKNAQKNIFG